jgi:hypothetical protein
MARCQPPPSPGCCAVDAPRWAREGRNHIADDQTGYAIRQVGDSHLYDFAPWKQHHLRCRLRYRRPLKHDMWHMSWMDRPCTLSFRMPVFQAGREALARSQEASQVMANVLSVRKLGKESRVVILWRTLLLTRSSEAQS